jgi:hypothetical protein
VKNLKKLVLGLAIIAAGMFLIVGTASAVMPDFSGWDLYSGLYDWYNSGGTWVYGSPGVSQGFSIGDISGIVKVEVKEERWTNPEAANEVVFSYTVFNACYDVPIGITSFHIANNGFLADEYLAPAGWTFSDSGGYWSWETSGAGIPHSGALNSMQVYYDTYDGWALVPGDVDVDGEWSGNPNWVASGPAPEPSSMLLLGMGLFGFFGRAARRKRFKA